MSASVRRISSLDALRTFAVALTVGHHWAQYAMPQSSNGVVQFFRTAGWAGVDLFFVLSGFLVSGLVFREYQRYGSFQLGDFFLRRGLRIYPGFYAFLATSVLYWMLTSRPPRPGAVINEALFIQNYRVSAWTHTWSLAIEEHFYLALGLGLFMAARYGVLRAASVRARLLYCGIALACYISRLETYWREGYTWSGIYAPSHQRLDGLFLGVLLAYLLHFDRDAVIAWLARWRKAVIGLSLPLCGLPLLLAQDSFAMCTWGLLAMSIGFGGIILCCATAAQPKPGRMQWLYSSVCRLGEYSYPLYLWHMLVLSVALIAGRRWHFPLGWTLALYVIGTVGLAFLATVLVDGPALRFRDRHFPSRSGTLAQISTDS